MKKGPRGLFAFAFFQSVHHLQAGHCDGRILVGIRTAYAKSVCLLTSAYKAAL
jgi:hypothetical protein